MVLTHERHPCRTPRDPVDGRRHPDPHGLRRQTVARHRPPTRLRNSNWSVPLGDVPSGANGWRFQGTDDDGLSLVFDVYRANDGWHVHRAYD